MNVSVTSLPLSDLEVDLLILPAVENADRDYAEDLVRHLGKGIKHALDDVGGKKGEKTLYYPEDARTNRVVIVGLGPADKVDAEDLRRAAATGAAIVMERKVSTIGLHILPVTVDEEVAAQAYVEGFLLGAYRFRKYKTDEEDGYAGPTRLVTHAEGAERKLRRGVENGRMIAESVATARDLVNLSPVDKTPTLLAKAIQKSGKRLGYDVSVWDKTLIEEEKMGGLLAVNRGSTEPPVLVALDWSPENPHNERPIVLVGKGVVFDTGGLSLKPTKNSMDYMKSDMAGAAAVVGAFEAIARLKLPLRVRGFIPVTDNRPGENAYVPGDVIRMHSGKTVEVLNTDAEGRLILADALSYARKLRPELVIDVATLTGAQVVALGSNVAAVMTNETDGQQDRIRAMQAAGERSGDRVHPLPMYEEYGEQLKSTVADIKNVGGKEAGTITAGKFLEYFVDYPWIHLDIAGPAFLHEDKPYRPKGGTGFGVRLLIEFLRDRADLRKSR